MAVRRQTDHAPRRKRFYQRPLAYLFEIVLCAGILTGGAYAFGRFVIDSEYFRVKSVRVEGVMILGGEEILEAAAITSADNLLSLDRKGVIARVKKIPYVKTCAVTRVFPNTVVIKIIERTATAALLVNNHIYQIDEEGMVLEEIPPGFPYVGPFITGVPDLAAVEPGQVAAHPNLREALDVWRSFAKSEMASQVTVSEISAAAITNIRMFCEELPYEIRWGRGDYDTQVMRLSVLWDNKRGRLNCQEYLDMRFGKDLPCK